MINIASIAIRHRYLSYHKIINSAIVGGKWNKVEIETFVIYLSLNKNTIIPSKAFILLLCLWWHYWKLYNYIKRLSRIVMQIILRRLFQFNSFVNVKILMMSIFAFEGFLLLWKTREWIHNQSWDQVFNWINSFLFLLYSLCLSLKTDLIWWIDACSIKLSQTDKLNLI